MAIVSCTTCNSSLVRNNSQIKASKTGNFFCSRECRSDWDSVKFESQKVEFTCPICNKNKNVVKSALRNKMYCSLKCLAKLKKENGNTTMDCLYCKKVFSKKNSLVSERNFCTKNCSSKWTSENLNTQVQKDCIICFKSYVVGNNRKDSAKTCSKKCHYEHIKIISNEGHMAEQLRKNGLKSLSSRSIKDTLPEIKVRELLIKEEIRFEEQKPMYGKFIVDFYLTDLDIVLEVFGDYWHCNPLVYGFEENKKTPNSHQLKQIKKDKARKGYLTKCGHKFATAWEKDIYLNLEKTIESIINQNP